MGYSIYFGSAHSGFGLHRIVLKNPGKIWVVKIVPKPSPIWAYGLAHFIFLKKLLVLNIILKLGVESNSAYKINL
jgi:hypothetical protein